jgi:hypothetical protein
MYFSKCVILNSGPIAKLVLNGAFNVDGTPKPIILVGANGSGKTGALSILADALAEIATKHYTDVLPTKGAGHSYFRILGGRNLRINQSYEVSALKFSHQNEDFFVRMKAGTVESSTLASELSDFEAIANFPKDGSDKEITGNEKTIEKIYKSGAYLFFPASRFEIPHWANRSILDRDVELDFTPQYSDKLGKPVIVQTAVQQLKPWLVECLNAQLVEANKILAASDLQQLQQEILQSHIPTLINATGLNQIISDIVGRPVRFARYIGGRRDQRICIADGKDLILPSIDHLSAGQSALLSIFGTIARYGNFPFIPLSHIEGIVIVDEIDDHLHADLQHNALPSLIKLFPKIQFILSSHSPLLLLGMKKTHGEEGFKIIELPSGLTIDPERFSEFEASFAYFQATQKFESTVHDRIISTERPLVLCEGETDPQYLKAASELLGFDNLASSINFDWVGTPDAHGAIGGGKSHLNDAYKFLKNNAQIQKQKILLLYDPETDKPSFDEGNLHVRKMPFNEDSQRKSGVENLLPKNVFEDRFFEKKLMGKGDDKGLVPVLNKKTLCDFLCREKRDPKDFENFRDTLHMIESLLLDQNDAQSPPAQPSR